MTEKNAIAIAKILDKELKEDMANHNDKNSFEVSFDGRVGITTYWGNNKTVFTFHGAKNIEFAYTDDRRDYGRFSCLVRDKFVALVGKRLGKFILIPHNNVELFTPRGTPWYSTYANQSVEVFKSATIVRPCKEFAKVQKKLEHFGFNLKPLDWRTDYVSGKRSHYGVTNSYYHCTNQKKCQEVLDALKGMKKASFDIKRCDNLEDREYGERYETEWSGSIDYALKVTTSKGSQVL